MWLPTSILRFFTSPLRTPGFASTSRPWTERDGPGAVPYHHSTALAFTGLSEQTCWSFNQYFCTPLPGGLASWYEYMNNKIAWSERGCQVVCNCLGGKSQSLQSAHIDSRSRRSQSREIRLYSDYDNFALNWVSKFHWPTLGIIRVP
jgi:hypothetical protein